MSDPDALTAATPRERPIIFTGESVRAILAGTKTQTRRVVKAHEITLAGIRGILGGTGPAFGACPYGVPGDRLWVREAFCHSPATYCWEASVSVPVVPAMTCYRADVDEDSYGPWTSPLFMPRGLSRLLLEITEVRVQRVQDISEEDARAEGISEPEPAHGHWCDPKRGREGHWSYRKPFAAVWDSINQRRGYSFASNCWVWVIGFKRINS